MRGIICRAKRKDNGEWVEGYYVKATDYLTEKPIHAIFPLDVTLFPHGEFSYHEEIIPETLGRRIEYPCYDGPHTGRTFFQGDIIGVYRDRRADIEHEEPDTIAIIVDEHGITENGLGRWFPQDTTAIKVLGNVHDNPELVGEKYADLYKWCYCLGDNEEGENSK